MSRATEVGAHPTALCWGTVPAASFAHLVEAAGSAGFDAVTISPALHLDVLGDGGRRALRLLDAAGVHVAAVDPLISPLPGFPAAGEVSAEHRRFIEPQIDEVLHLVEATGAESVNLAHFLGGAVPIGEMVDAIAPICGRARDLGCQVTLEFIPGTGVPDLSTAVEVVRLVDADNFGVMLDNWHLARSGGRPTDVASTDPGTITGVQLCDRRPPAPGESYVPMAGRLLPGEGELPLADLVAAILSVTSDVTFGIEVFDPGLAMAPTAETAVRALAALRSVLPGR